VNSISKFYILFLLLFSLNSFDAISQIAIKGTVTYKSKPIEFARVSIYSLSKHMLTNANGSFHFSELPVGTHIIECSAIGLRSIFDTINIDNMTKDLELSMIFSQEIMELDAIVVTGTKTFKRKTNSNVIVNVISGESLEELQSCNLAEGLRFQPGLRVETDCQTCNYTQLRMNGLAGGYSQVLINGRPIFSPLTGLYGLEQLPVNMIERVEVIRGGGSSLYGSSAIGGTVNVITKLPKANSFDVNYTLQNINTRSIDEILNGNFTTVNKEKNFGLSLFINTRRREFYDHNDDGFSELPLLKNNSVGITSFYLPKENHKFELSISNLNEYRFGGEMRGTSFVYEREQAEERTHRVWMASADYQINFNGDLSSLIAYAAYQHTYRSHYTGIIPDDTLALTAHYANPPYGISNVSTMNIGVQLNHKLESFLTTGPNIFTFGAELLYDDVFDEIPSYGYLIDQEIQDLGMFLQSDWALLPNLNLLSGCRMDINNTVDNPIWSPRISLLYKLKKNTQLRLSYGSGFRAPQAFDTDMHIAFAGGGVSRVTLDPNLKEERSQSYSASINYDKPYENFIFGFTFEGFQTILSDAFFLQPNGSDDFGFLFEKQNGQSAKVSGLTTEFRANYRKIIQLEAGGTIQANRYDIAIPYIDGVSPTRNFIRTPNSYGFAIITLNPIKKVSMNLNYVYTGEMLVPHFSGAENQQIDEMLTTNDFSNVSFKLNYAIDLKKPKLIIECYIGIKNMFNAYQTDFDIGKNRDSNFIYGPAQPRTFFGGIKLRSGTL
jgi:outer membrane receptor for ferrienterochelin and colicins